MREFEGIAKQTIWNKTERKKEKTYQWAMGQLHTLESPKKGVEDRNNCEG